MKLYHKIFAANALATFLLFFVIVACMRGYAVKHAKASLREQESKGLVLLAETLAAHYQSAGGWAFMATHPEKLAGMIESVFSKLPPFDMGPMGPQPHPDRPPMPPPDRRGGPPFPKIIDPVRRITLCDKDRKYVAGPADLTGDVAFHPVGQGGETFGWLKVKQIGRLPDPVHTAGLKQKLYLFYFISFLIFLATGLVSYFVSRLMLSPVKKLAAGTKALARFDFDTRVRVGTRDELGQLAEDFNAMADTIQAYESMQKQWMLDISHELRTPLSVLKGETEAMLDGVRRVDTDSIRSLYMEVRALEMLVKDLHFLSREDAKSLEMKKEPVYPALLLADLLERFKRRLSAEGIRLVSRLSRDRLRVSGDAGRLNQLFANILENSLRYTEKPGTLTIRQEQEDRFLVLIFEDSGPGVPETALKRLFDRLYRVDKARGGAERGSGLGLSICHAIVTAHKGCISAENAPGAGLRIKIRLPLA